MSLYKHHFLSSILIYYLKLFLCSSSWFVCNGNSQALCHSKANYIFAKQEYHNLLSIVGLFESIITYLRQWRTVFCLNRWYVFNKKPSIMGVHFIFTLKADLWIKNMKFAAPWILKFPIKRLISFKLKEPSPP